MQFDASLYKKQNFENIQQDSFAPFRLFVIDGRNHRYAENLNEYYEDWKTLTNFVTADILELEQEKGIQILNRGKQHFDPQNKNNRYFEDIVFIEKQEDKDWYFQGETSIVNGKEMNLRTNDESFFNPNYYLGDSVYFSVYNNSITPDEFNKIFDLNFEKLDMSKKYKYHLSTGLYETDNQKESLDKVFRLDAENFIESSHKAKVEEEFFASSQKKANNPFKLFLLRPNLKDISISKINDFITAVTKDILALEKLNNKQIFNKDKGVIFVKDQADIQTVLKNVDSLFEKSFARKSIDKIVSRKMNVGQTDYATNIVVDEIYGPLFRANQIDNTILGSHMNVVNPVFDSEQNLISFSLYNNTISEKEFLNLVKSNCDKLGLKLDFGYGSATYETENPATIATELFRVKAKYMATHTIKNKQSQMEAMNL